MRGMVFGMKFILEPPSGSAPSITDYPLDDSGNIPTDDSGNKPTAT